MLDSTTRKPITVLTDGITGPYVLVPRDQVDCVKELLDRERVPYSVSAGAIRMGHEPIEDVINLGYADPTKVQMLLDAATVRVSIRFVDGGSREYYCDSAIIEKYELLQRQGVEGKHLVNQLFTHDWGAPPTSIRMDGNRSDGSRFRVNIEYQ